MPRRVGQACKATGTKAPSTSQQRMEPGCFRLDPQHQQTHANSEADRTYRMQLLPFESRTTLTARPAILEASRVEPPSTRPSQSLQPVPSRYLRNPLRPKNSPPPLGELSKPALARQISPSPRCRLRAKSSPQPTARPPAHPRPQTPGARKFQRWESNKWNGDREGKVM